MDLRILTAPTILKPDVNLYANSVTAGTITAVNTLNVTNLEVKGDLLVDGSFQSAGINAGNILLSGSTQNVALPAGTNGGTLAFNNTLNKLITSGVSGANTAASTLDGSTWTQLTTPFANPAIAYSPSLNVYTGLDGSGNAVYTSPTAVNGSWTIRPVAPAAFDISNIFWSSFFGRFYTNSSNAVARVSSSLDGITYTNAASSRDAIQFAFSPLLSRLVAVGGLGPQYSDDGKVWTPSPSSVVPMSSVCWSDFWKCFVAIPRTGVLTNVWRSTDGITWTSTTGFPGFGGNLRSIVWIEELMVFVVCGDSDVQFISQDGLLFQQNQNTPGGAKYGNTYVSRWGMYVATGIGQDARVSPKLYV